MKIKFAALGIFLMLSNKLFTCELVFKNETGGNVEVNKIYNINSKAVKETLDTFYLAKGATYKIKSNEFTRLNFSVGSGIFFNYTVCPLDFVHCSRCNLLAKKRVFKMYMDADDHEGDILRVLVTELEASEETLKNCEYLRKSQESSKTKK